jgi:hypothetical protein
MRPLRLTAIESKVGCRRPTVGLGNVKMPVLKAPEDPRKLESFL